MCHHQVLIAKLRKKRKRARRSKRLPRTERAGARASVGVRAPQKATPRGLLSSPCPPTLSILTASPAGGVTSQAADSTENP